MEKIKYLNEQEEKIIESFYALLEERDAVGGVENPTGLLGFLFGLAITPEVIMPSEWIDLLYDSETFYFDSKEQFESLYTIVMKLYNDYLSAFNNKTLRFPYKFNAKELKNDLTVKSELGKWLQGFFLAIYLRPNIWKLDYEWKESDKLSPKDEAILIAVYSISRIIRSYIRSIDPDIAAEFNDDEEFNEDEIYEIMLNIPDIINTFVAYGTIKDDERRKNFINKNTTESKTAVKIGRNDPCPCGSGKKYKKCCGIN
ncbi:MAG: UPF0149 family protein [Candidatus Acidulodesulfobacterium sp.]